MLFKVVVCDSYPNLYKDIKALFSQAKRHVSPFPIIMFTMFVTVVLCKYVFIIKS